MFEVVMRDTNAVLINGTPAGGLVDAVLNNRDAAAAIHDAFTAWLTQHDADLVSAEQVRAADAALVVAANTAEATEAMQVQLRDMTERADKCLQQAQNWQARYQETAVANQKLVARVKELEGQLIAALDTANKMIAGTTDQAVAAARELNRLNAMAQAASLAAQLAEHERIASESKSVEQPAA